jgi:hydrogenase nickel incorporation protein HypA/HybF
VHELSIATSLVEAVLDIAKKQGATKILEVQLRVGKLRLISLDQLRFSYEILSRDTLLEGSRLRIQETPGFTRCPNCGYAKQFETSDMSFHFTLPTMKCPKCATNLKIEGGDECVITKVRMALPSRPSETKGEGRPEVMRPSENVSSLYRIATQYITTLTTEHCSGLQTCSFGTHLWVKNGGDKKSSTRWTFHSNRLPTQRLGAASWVKAGRHCHP